MFSLGWWKKVIVFSKINITQPKILALVYIFLVAYLFRWRVPTSYNRSMQITRLRDQVIAAQSAQLGLTGA